MTGDLKLDDINFALDITGILAYFGSFMHINK